MKWNDNPEVLSPVGQTIKELLKPKPRRQTLNNFDPIYCDIVDYIIRCTHRIWEEKNIGLCYTHYSEDCQLHTLSGPTVGSKAVVRGTIGALAAFSDRAVVGEDVIWSEDEPGLFYSSHRIRSDGTHMGDDAMGMASMNPSGVMTIADCVVKENLIIEEWLVRDNLLAAAQLGHNPWDIARSQASSDQQGDLSRHSWREEWIESVKRNAATLPPNDHPARIYADALILAFRESLFGDAVQHLSPAVEVQWPTQRHGFGEGYWIGCVLQICAALSDLSLSIDHWAARPLPNGDIAVAIRWTLTGKHTGSGVWGQPSGREILLLNVSHLRMRGDKVVEDITLFDELAVLRQIAGGLGA
ncbi:nuclear transport factor 2 family protein [Alteromonas oceanisediminis]|uniref:nuclear transport factor 2 family protein n=1 Tax=Alteromonas oceanisediminis TaxID=2836180 RepID=UPI001BDA5F6E|nr:ester cyclase [Alteromonas oceanisediminis]MBT0585587.1 ester cyclase [Alteromonas oceanisediminis]